MKTFVTAFECQQSGLNMESPSTTPRNVSCALCRTSDETEITGALSSKQNLSAHQNCLLFASGIYCQNSPTYDDLFGFDVKDVERELRRGQKLICHKCNKRGATAGCDVQRCKRSYHYPCAIEDGARAIEDWKTGRFKVLCELHDPKSDETSINAETSLLKASTSGPSGSRRRNSVDLRRPELDGRDSNSPTGSSVGSSSRKSKRKSVMDSAMNAETSLPEASTSGPSGSRRRRLVYGQRPELDRRDSNSPTGSSVGSSSRKNKRKSVMDSDDDVEYPELRPIESDFEDCTSPEPHNRSTPEPKRPCRQLNPSATDSLKEDLTSDQKAYGSADSSVELHDRSKLDSPTDSLDVEIPKRKRKKLISSSDDDVVLVLSDPEESEPQKKPNQSSPVPEKKRYGQNRVFRPCEKRDSSATGADDDDTDIDLDDNKSTTQGCTKPQWAIETEEESQSLLPFIENVLCTVVLDSGPSVESDNSLELCFPASAAPGAVRTSPVSAAVPKTPSTSRTTDRAPTTGTVLLGSADSATNQDRVCDDPSDRPGSPQHSGRTADKSPSDSTTDQQPEHFPKGGGHQSPDRPKSTPVCDVQAEVNSQSNAAKFWTRCNQAEWTKEIFSELQSHLSSLGERVQSQKASHEDFDVALKVLEASGRLPHIIAQLEEDLEMQEKDLQRKKAALRDARAVLGV